MTQEEIYTEYYKENDWSWYIYNPTSRTLISELIKFVDSHPDTTYLSCHKSTHDTNVLETSNINIYLYYQCIHRDLYREITSNPILDDWIDGDGTTFDNEYISKLKNDTIKTKYLLNKLIDLDDEFNKLFEN